MANKVESSAGMKKMPIPCKQKPYIWDAAYRNRHFLNPASIQSNYLSGQILVLVG